MNLYIKTWSLVGAFVALRVIISVTVKLGKAPGANTSWMFFFSAFIGWIGLTVFLYCKKNTTLPFDAPKFATFILFVARLCNGAANLLFMEVQLKKSVGAMNVYAITVIVFVSGFYAILFRRKVTFNTVLVNMGIVFAVLNAVIGSEIFYIALGVAGAVSMAMGRVLSTYAFHFMQDYSDAQRTWVSMSADLVVYLMLFPFNAAFFDTTYAPFINWTWPIYVQMFFNSVIFFTIAALVNICPVCCQMGSMAGYLVFVIMESLIWKSYKFDYVSLNATVTFLGIALANESYYTRENCKECDLEGDVNTAA